MISTPNAPGGLFYNIEKEPEESCFYKRLKMDYNCGLGRIYTVKEIEKAKQSPGFDREYGLQYLGKIGNIFTPSCMKEKNSYIILRIGLQFLYNVMVL